MIITCLYPSLGLALIVAWLVDFGATSRLRYPILGIYAVWITAFCFATYQWNQHWKSKQALAEQTLKWQPENFVILRALAKTAIDSGDEDLAEKLLSQAAELAPWYSPIHYHKIALLQKQKRYQEAIAILARLTDLQSHMAKPFVFLAYIRDIHLGEWQAAETLLNTALEKPWDEQYSKSGAMNLAYIYLKTDRKQFALQIYEYLLARYPNDLEISEKYQSIKDLGTIGKEVRDPSETL